MADQESAASRPIRFEATVHPRAVGGVEGELADAAAREGHVAELDLDRVPDPDGGIRLLIDAEQCTRLLERGFEVRLLRAVAVAPLAPELVADDDTVTSWFHQRAGADGPDADG